MPTTALRCSAIELHLAGADKSLIRRWQLSYVQDEANDASLLHRVVLSGFDDAGGRLGAPAGP